jgi:hypothetical protein
MASSGRRGPDWPTRGGSIDASARNDHPMTRLRALAAMLMSIGALCGCSSSSSSPAAGNPGNGPTVTSLPTPGTAWTRRRTTTESPGLQASSACLPAAEEPPRPYRRGARDRAAFRTADSTKEFSFSGEWAALPVSLRRRERSIAQFRESCRGSGYGVGVSEARNRAAGLWRPRILRRSACPKRASRLASPASPRYPVRPAANHAPAGPTRAAACWPALPRTLGRRSAPPRAASVGAAVGVQRARRVV